MRRSNPANDRYWLWGLAGLVLAVVLLATGTVRVPAFEHQPTTTPAAAPVPGGPAVDGLAARARSTATPTAGGLPFRLGAICADDTTSTATGSGACSWHGGVASWVRSDCTLTEAGAALDAGRLNDDCTLAYTAT
jgi:hypothetical protein